MIEAIRTFMLTCPYIDELAKLGIDFLSSQPVNYSIDAVPIDPIVAEYIDGSTLRRLIFNFDGRLRYSEEVKNNIDNSKSFEDIQDWLEDQSKKGILPILPSGKKATKIEALSNGYLFDTPETMDSATYRIQCILEYEKEA